LIPDDLPFSSFDVHPYISFGRLHLPVFGLFSAAGLMAGLALTQRTAAPAGVDRDALWDAGMVTALSAFALSRLLLVLAGFHTFLEFPIMVLALPSMTRFGLALTAVVAWIYLRHRRLPVLRVMDAMAPCVALMEAFRSVGRMVDGTREGIPTAMPWATTSGYGTVHPVEAYMLATELALCVGLMWMVYRRHRAGQVFEYGLLAGGMAAFVLDFFRSPTYSHSYAWFEGVQWTGIAMMLGGLFLTAGRLFGTLPPEDAVPGEPMDDLSADAL
jgi:phosphatidylglycerol:prolipoprotein diacylglycerol transferase